MRIACVGICGTDLSLWKKGQLGIMKVEQPLVLGHEASGTVEKVGRGVLHLKEGMFVLFNSASITVSFTWKILMTLYVFFSWQETMWPLSRS